MNISDINLGTLGLVIGCVVTVVMLALLYFAIRKRRFEPGPDEVLVILEGGIEPRVSLGPTRTNPMRNQVYRVKMVPVRVRAASGGPDSRPTRDDLRVEIRLELVVRLPKRVDAVVDALSRLDADKTHLPEAVEAEYRRDIETQLEHGVSTSTFGALEAAAPGVPETLRHKLALMLAPYELVDVTLHELRLTPAEQLDPENLSHQVNLRALAQRHK